MSKCVLCFVEHDRLWHDSRPNMYCEACEPIRQAARGTTSRILSTLYLSDMDAAGKFEGARLCVYDNPPTYEGDHHHIPILAVKPRDHLVREGAVASIEQLNKAAALIESYVNRKERLVVHCHGGVERSPLTIAWFLVKTKRCQDLKQAYEFIRAFRPVVSERLFWLPEGFSIV